MDALTVVGARPQFIKAGPVSRSFRAQHIDEKIIHTGQHYDLNMSDVFFRTLGLREPDYHLGIGSGGHGSQTGRMLAAIENILIDVAPDVVLVYGDTNSTLAGALAAAKLNIPVAHVEAGLRSFNRRMPEEVNRVLTDHVATLLFCPTVTAVDHLEGEGVTQGVHLVGDVMKDALDYWKMHEDRSPSILQKVGIGAKAYYLATVHRAENVDSPDRLNAIMAALGSLDLPVVLPVHPRTRDALASRNQVLPANVMAVDPVGYLEMLELESNARAVLTDSGGVQKEAFMLGVPCITLRDETEWVETLTAGWNTLTGADPELIFKAVNDLRTDRSRPELYGDGHASERIAQVTASFVRDRGTAHVGG